MLLAERLLDDRLESRLNMINAQLRPNGINNPRLVQAFETVPMEAFVPPTLQPIAYCDNHLALTSDPQFKRWLLAPQVLGKLLQLANIQPSDKVLIVGCGSGYSIALSAQLAAHIIGIECDEDLAHKARLYAAEAEIYNIQVVTGDLSVGYPKDSPYDVILLEGAVDHVPMTLLQQLSSHNGRFVTVIKKQFEFGKGVLMTRLDDKVTQSADFEASCPYLPGFEQQAEFQF